MEKIGMFWGSNTGNQEEAAGFLKEYMESEGAQIDEYNIADTDPKKMLEYKGSSEPIEGLTYIPFTVTRARNDYVKL